MPNSEDQSPGEDYFNDLAQQPSNGPDDAEQRQEDPADGQVSKPKRIACVLCRKRKLRCDGNKPSCGTCTRLQHDCCYDVVRRKSGPKRGYVKALEARLAQVETLLKTQDEPPTQRNAPAGLGSDMVTEYQDIITGGGRLGVTSKTLPRTHRSVSYGNDQQQPTLVPTPTSNIPGEEPFPWEMIGLGLDEPLPNQDVINGLNEAYFEKIHPTMPIIHRPRFYAAMNLAPHMRPPVCLRYAMWCNVASVVDKFDEQLHEHFYMRARKYIHQDEMKGHGESMITIAHAQTWILLATYEFKHMMFPRAWMSAGRGCRMVQMMGLHRLDGVGLDVKQCLPPPRDWTEREERRRTFWMAFCVDRYSSIGTGWPMTIEERDIMTTLPADEESYELSRPGKNNMTLEDALNPDGIPNISAFGGVIVMAALFGRNLTHLHRPSAEDADDDLNGEFWKRHRGMDNVLLNTTLSLPDPLRLPAGLNDPNIVFLNMCIHTSTICLHQAAIFKADKNRMPSRISAESKVRCITAAAEIASIMRQISHLDLSAMNPFISFSLYVAARVFVQYLKSRPKDAQIKTSLQFLLSAMQAIKRKNPLTESFLVQLDVDLEGAGFEDSLRNQTTTNNGMPGGLNRSEASCPVAPFNMGNQDAQPFHSNYAKTYQDPNTNVPIPTTAPADPSTFDYTKYMPGENPMGFIHKLPSRQRSPGSNQGSSTMHRSPQSYNMDVSPDHSTGDHLTPNSSTQSQQNISTHTSNTGYSPQDMQPPTPGRLTAIFAPNDPSFVAEFDMENFPVSTADTQQHGFVLPSNWGSGSTGLTPGPTGMTPGASGMGDMMGMSDADWNQIMNNMNLQEWENNTELHGMMQQGRQM